MIDSSEKCNRQLAFELQILHVCEKRSNKLWFLLAGISIKVSVWMLTAKEPFQDTSFKFYNNPFQRSISDLSFGGEDPSGRRAGVS